MGHYQANYLDEYLKFDSTGTLGISVEHAPQSYPNQGERELGCLYVHTQVF